MTRLLKAIILAAVTKSAAARTWGIPQIASKTASLDALLSMPHGGDASDLEAAKSAALQNASEKVRSVYNGAIVVIDLIRSAILITCCSTVKIHDASFELSTERLKSLELKLLITGK